MRILVCALLLLPTLALAQPTVSGVSPSGTITHDSSITISGSTFGQKPQAAPFKWDTFEAGADRPLNTLLDTVQPEWVQFVNNRLGGLMYTNEQTHSGTRSVYNAVNRAGAGPNGNELWGQWEANYLRLPESNTVFISYWYRMDSSSGAGVAKFSRITSSTAAGGGGVYNEQGSMAMGGSGPCNAPIFDVCNDTDGGVLDYLTYASGNNVYFNWEPSCGEWVHIQMGRTLNDIGVNNGWFTADIVGHERQNWPNNQNVYATGSHNGKALQLDTVLMMCSNSSFVPGNDTRMFVDDMYIDTTRARVELGNNATWLNCTHTEMQIPTSWSPGAIDINVNTGSFAAGAAWLFVFNENGQVSPGFPVTVAGGAPQLGPGKPGKPGVNQ